MKKLKELGKFILIFFIYLLINNFVALLFINDINSKNLFISNLSQITVCIVVTTIFIFIYRKTLVKDFFNLKKSDLSEGFKYWTLGLLMMIITNVIITSIGGTMVDNEALNRELIQNYLPYSIVAMAIEAPIIEELIFRKSLRGITNNKYLYATISGLIFGSLHLLNELLTMDSLVNLLFILPYSALGFSFALAYYKTDNIFSSIVFHALHNGIAILSVIFM